MLAVNIHEVWYGDGQTLSKWFLYIENQEKNALRAKLITHMSLTIAADMGVRRSLKV